MLYYCLGTAFRSSQNDNAKQLAHGLHKPWWKQDFFHTVSFPPLSLAVIFITPWIPFSFQLWVISFMALSVQLRVSTPYSVAHPWGWGSRQSPSAWWWRAWSRLCPSNLTLIFLYRHGSWREPVNPYYVNTGYALAPATSANDSEQQSMSSDADTMSLTDSSV